MKRSRELFEFVDREFGGSTCWSTTPGVGVFRPISELSVQDWQDYDRNKSHRRVLLRREAVVAIRNREMAVTSSISVVWLGKNPFAGGAAYNASKFGMNGFSEAVMLDERNRERAGELHHAGQRRYGVRRPPASEGEDWKIWPEDVAEIVGMLIRMPERTLISRVEVRPARPKR